MSALYAHYLKRVFDLVLSAFLIISLSWLFLLIVVIYVLQAELPVFFRQKRLGKNEQAFVIFKFRTLKTSTEPLEKRTFAWGTFLRSTSLDELPQLFNVLTGQMSLVGPRPLPVEYAPLFSEDQRIRHHVRPGVTGWAQVNGRTAISWQEKFRLDSYYVRNVSFGLDLKIIIRTIVLFFNFKRDTSLNEKAFTGNE